MGKIKLYFVQARSPALLVHITESFLRNVYFIKWLNYMAPVQPEQSFPTVLTTARHTP
jgi:hypothetical protein